MRAIVWTKYGPPDGLQVRDVAKPAPKADELLIGVRATTVTTGDCELRSFRTPGVFTLAMRLYNGLTRPKRLTILGQEVAGDVEDVGTDVTSFEKGDAVFAATSFRLGGYAEYVCLSETGTVARKPAQVGYEEAAAVPLGGLEARHYLRKGNLRPGERLLINGAGGSIGTLAVQLAKLAGAEVTAVDSGDKLDMLRSIGADHLIDFTRENFTENGRAYDVLFDVIGSTSRARCEGSLGPDGRFVSANPGTLEQLRGLWNLIVHHKRVVAEYTRRRQEDLAYLSELLEAGKLKPVLDRCYPLEQAAEAHRYVDSGRKQGNVVLTVAPP